MSLEFTVSFLSFVVAVQAVYLLIMARTLTRLDFQFKAMRDDMFEIFRFMRTGEMRFEKYSATAAYKELFEKRVGTDHSESQPQQGDRQCSEAQ